MTLWRVAKADLLDTEADGLLCSANPSLNLSGGVGGAFAMRFGSEMQVFLHDYLRNNGLRHIAPGDAVIAPPCGSPFKAVAHAVAIDAFYDTSPELILRTYDRALRALADLGCATIAAACLGCGYGRVSPSNFSIVAKELFKRGYEGVERVTLISTNEELVQAIEGVLANTGR